MNLLPDVIEPTVKYTHCVSGSALPERSGLSLHSASWARRLITRRENAIK